MHKDSICFGYRTTGLSIQSANIAGKSKKRVIKRKNTEMPQKNDSYDKNTNENRKNTEKP